MRSIFKLANLFYAILLCTPSFAQKKTASGFYISLQGDTVQGIFSSYSQWSKNPSAVEFATGTMVKPTLLTPQNCRKFVVEGYDEYLSYAGQRLVNPIYDYQVLNHQYSSVNDELEEVITFLRLVIRTPNCELYTFTDTKRTNFFYRLPGDSVVELKNKKYNVEGQINASTEYKDQLNNLFTDAIYRRKLTSSLKTLPYMEEKLKSFFEQLFTAEAVKHKKKDPTAGWIVATGAALTFVNVKSENIVNYVAKNYNTSISPLFSIGYIAPISRNFGKYFLYPQISLFRFKNTGEIDDDIFKKVTTYQTDMVISGEINGGVNVINQQNIRLYLSGGAGMSTFLNNKRIDDKYENNPPSSRPFRSEQKDIALNASPVINASTGVVLNNRLIVAASYLFPAPLENVFTYKPRFSGLQLRIGYKVK